MVSDSEWGDADELRLAYLCGMGLATSEIARRMGRTKSSVYAKARKLGLITSRCTALSADDEREIARMRRHGMSVRRIAAAVHHSREKVAECIRRNGIEVAGGGRDGDAECSSPALAYVGLPPEARLTAQENGEEICRAAMALRRMGCGERTVDKVIGMRYGLTEGIAAMVVYCCESAQCAECGDGLPDVAEGGGE